MAHVTAAELRAVADDAARIDLPILQRVLHAAADTLEHYQPPERIHRCLDGCGTRVPVAGARCTTCTDLRRDGLHRPTRRPPAPDAPPPPNPPASPDGRAWPCPDCDRVFTTFRGLGGHRQVHTMTVEQRAERSRSAWDGANGRTADHPCPLCSTAWSSAQRLAEHITRAHPT